MAKAREKLSGCANTIRNIERSVVVVGLITLALTLLPPAPKDTLPAINLNNNPSALITGGGEIAPTPIPPEFPLKPGEVLLQPGYVDTLNFQDGQKQITFSSDFASVKLNNVTHTGQFIKYPDGTDWLRVNINSQPKDLMLIYEKGIWGWFVPEVLKQSNPTCK